MLLTGFSFLVGFLQKAMSDVFSYARQAVYVTPMRATNYYGKMSIDGNVPSDEQVVVQEYPSWDAKKARVPILSDAITLVKPMYR